MCLDIARHLCTYTNLYVYIVLTIYYIYVTIKNNIHGLCIYVSICLFISPYKFEST